MDPMIDSLTRIFFLIIGAVGTIYGFYRLGYKSGYRKATEDFQMKHCKTATIEHNEPRVKWYKRLINQLKEIWRRLHIPLLILMGILAVILLSGVFWFHFDRPTLVQYTFRVSPSNIEGTQGKTIILTIDAQFSSFLGTAMWLKLHRPYYSIHCPDDVIPRKIEVVDANFESEVKFTVHQNDVPKKFYLKDRDCGVIDTSNVIIKVISNIPRRGIRW